MKKGLEDKIIKRAYVSVEIEDNRTAHIMAKHDIHELTQHI